MKKTGAILGIIGGVFGFFGAIATLFFGGMASNFGASGASGVIGLGWGGLVFSVLAVVFGAQSISARTKRPAMLLTASSALGAVLGGLLVAGSLALSLLGGILAWIGTPRDADDAGLGSPATPKRGGRNLWIAGVATAVISLIAAGVVGSRDDATKAPVPAASAQPTGSLSLADGDPPVAPEANPTPLRKVGDAIAGQTFRVTVTAVHIASNVGGDIIHETASPGAEYVAVEWNYVNISGAPINAFAVPTLNLVDPSGHDYNADLAASTAYASQINADAKTLSDVNPGILIHDGTAFEVSRALFDPNTWNLRLTSQDGVVDIALGSENREWQYENRALSSHQ